MTIAAELLSPWLSAFLWGCLVVTCALAAWHADWAALRAVPRRSHLVFGGTVASLLLWLISVNAIEGFWFHFLGVTSLTLLLGWRFSVLAGSVAVLAHTLLIGQSLAAVSSAWLLTVFVPASVSRWLVYRLRRHKSRNLFVYMLGAGFGGGLLSGLAMALTAIGVLWMGGQRDLAMTALANWPMIPLIMFPEGFINGMVISTLTVFYPDLLKTFDERYYLEED